MPKFAGVEPPRPYDFAMGDSSVCFLCQQPDRAILIRVGASTPGICEACTVLAHHHWHKHGGEVPPGFTKVGATEISRVHVVIARLKEQSYGKGDPGCPASYELVATTRLDGSFDLPGVALLKGEDVTTSALRALTEVKLSSWSYFLEPLYKAYTPRGRLVQVVLATAWMALGDTNAIMWRPWPFSEHAGDLEGFYYALEDVWAMRLVRHQAASAHTEEISVYMREGAVKYLTMQMQVRKGAKGVDTSMSELLLKTMTPDERKVERAIRDYEEKAKLLAKQKAEAKAASGSGTLKAEDDSMSSEDADSEVADEQEGNDDEAVGSQGRVDEDDEVGTGDGARSEDSEESEDDDSDDGEDSDDEAEVSDGEGEEGGEVEGSSGKEVLSPGGGDARRGGGAVVSLLSRQEPRVPPGEDDEATGWPEIAMKPTNEIIEGVFVPSQPTADGFVRPARPLTRK